MQIGDPPPLNTSQFRIPRIAWLVVIAAIMGACASAWFLPGPAMKGCLHAKGCFPVPRLPLVVAGGLVMLGVGVSIVVGRIPRHWLMGWNFAVAGLATLAVVGAPLVLLSLGFANSITGGVALVTGVMLTFATLFVGQMAVSLVSTAIVGPQRVDTTPLRVVFDGRPGWQQQVTAVHAAVEDGAANLAASETQLVAELAYELQDGEDGRPDELSGIGAQLLQYGNDRAVVLRLLKQADSAAAKAPYRSQ